MARRALAFVSAVRKLGGWISGPTLVLLSAAAIIALVAPWAYSPSVLRVEMVARIRDLTGLEAVAQGEPVLVLLPRPRVAIDDIGFADPSGALRVETRHLEGFLRLDALLAGRLEVARVRLDRPKLVIDSQGRPMPPDSAIGRAAQAKSATPQATSADEARLGAVELVDGTAHIVSGPGGPEIRIDSINVTVDWPKLGGAARFSGHLGWNGETAAIEASIARPVELIRGEPSGLAFAISAPAASLSFDGMLESMPGPRLTGRLAASAASVRRLVLLAGASDPFPLSFEDMALTCDATIAEGSAECAALRLWLDGNEFHGTLALRPSAEGVALSGTVATESFSLRPYAASLPAAFGRDGQWSRAPFDPRPRLAPHLDLRLSARRIDLGRLELENASIMLVSGPGRLEVVVPAAETAGGSIGGRASFTTADSAVGLRASTDFAGVSLAASTRGSSGSWRIAGSITGSAVLESSGTSMSEFMHNLKGNAEVELKKGEFSGIDLEHALHRLETQPLALAGEVNRGATGFETASFGLEIAKGVAEVERGLLRTPLADLVVGGSADIAERTLNLRAVAMPSAAAQDGPSPENQRFRFDVAGTFDSPLFLPDVRSLIRRSDAAAPLFRHMPEASNRQGAARDRMQ